MYNFYNLNNLDITFLISMDGNFSSKIKQYEHNGMTVGDYTTEKASSYEMIFVLEGDYYSTYGDKTFHMEKNCLLMLPKRADEPKKYQVSIKKNMLKAKKETIDVFFDTTTPMPDEPFMINTTQNHNIRADFLKMRSEWNIKQPGNYHKCLGLLYMIFAELENLYEATYISPSQYNRIKPAIDYIYEHCLEKDFDYSVLPKLCSVGYSYFKRIFKLKFGSSPSQFIIDTRMSKACELLKGTNYSVTEISQMVGYSDIYYFSKVFKNHFGLSPSAYKEANMQ